MKGSPKFVKNIRYLGIDLAYPDLNFRWIQWFWFHSSLDSTYVCLWCNFAFDAVQQQNERTRFVNWILLCCLQFSLDSTMLISIFAGFNLWWISLDISLRRLSVMQAPWLPCLINLCGRTIRALCPMWVFGWFFFVVSGMEFAHTCHSFVFWYKCLCSNAFALIPIAFGLRSHDTARWTCVGSFAETVVVSVARTSFWMLIFVDLQPIEAGVSWCFWRFLSA